MTQFESLYILLSVLALLFQALSVLHPVVKDVVEHLAPKHKRLENPSAEKGLLR